jgi:hypothetical protein
VAQSSGHSLTFASSRPPVMGREARWGSAAVGTGGSIAA